MSYKLLNGEYEIDANDNPIKIEYTQELLQNAVLAAMAQRRKFYPDKNFGSFLKGLDRAPFEKYAEAFIRQATDSLDGVFLIKAIKENENLTAIFEINGETKEVIIQIEQGI